MATSAKLSFFEESGRSSTQASCNSDDSTPRPATVPIPSLYAVYLPYKTQRRLLSSLQLKLEESCFEFARKWLPDMIAAEGWEDAEQVRLSEWTIKIHKERKAFPRNAITLHVSEEEFEEILFATHKLEHCAIHRDRISASRIAELVECALALVSMLKDAARACSIERIGRTVKLSLESMEDKKRALEKTLNSEMEIIARKRAELDLLEKSAVDRIKKQDKTNELAAGSDVDEVLDQDKSDFQIGSFQRNCGGKNHRSAAFEGDLSEWGSPTTRKTASTQARPEAGIPGNAASDSNMIGRSPTSKKQSVLPVNNKPSGGTETAQAPSRTYSTGTSQQVKGPLFTLQLSDSIHNPVYQSTTVHDKLDFYRLSLDYIDAPKTIGELSQSAVSTESKVYVPTPSFSNSSDPRRNLDRLHQGPVKNGFGSPSKYVDSAATTDDEIIL